MLLLFLKVFVFLKLNTWCTCTCLWCFAGRPTCWDWSLQKARDHSETAGWRHSIYTSNTLGRERYSRGSTRTVCTGDGRHQRRQWTAGVGVDQNWGNFIYTHKEDPAELQPFRCGEANVGSDGCRFRTGGTPQFLSDRRKKTKKARANPLSGPRKGCRHYW